MTELAWHRVRVPFRVPFATAAGTWAARDSWILVLRDGAGRPAIGEAVVEAGSREAAVDAARLDLAEPPADGRPPVGVNATIGATGVEAAVEAAGRAVEAGFRTLKLKAVPSETAASLADRLGAVRAAVGDGIALRLDVNGTWDLDGAAERLRAVDAVGLEYVEQPLGVDALAEAAILRGRTAVRVAADEAVTSQAAVRAILATGAADVLVVKPARVGGPRMVAAIAAMAAEHGVPVVVSSLFETGVGLAAGIACAAGLPDVPGWPAAERDHGLATADLLEDDLILEPLVVERGRIRAPGGPGSGGLGVTLDGDALERYRVTRR